MRALPLALAAVVLLQLGVGASGALAHPLESRVQRVVDDVFTSITVNGASVTVTLGVGEKGFVTFSGTSGEYLGLGLTAPSFSACCVSVDVKNPDGSRLILGGFRSLATDMNFPKLTYPGTGTYTIVLDPGPNNPNGGSVTLTLSDDLVGSIQPEGPPVTVTIGRAGQNERLAFTGVGGDWLTLLFSSDTFSTGGIIWLYDATDTRLFFSSFIQLGQPPMDFPVLPGQGVATFTIVVDPGVNIGAVTLTLAHSGPRLGQSFGTCTGAGLHALSASVCTADPVNSVTGAFTDSETDLSLPAPGVSFAFTRTYTSADSTSGRLGPGWTDSYSASLAVQQNGDVLVHGEDGQQVYYTKQPDGSFRGAPGALSVLSAIPGGFKLLRHDQVAYQFDAAGVLQSMLDRNGQGVSLAYTSGKLTGITDAVGRAIALGYQGSLLHTVTTPDQRQVVYDYNPNGQLASVTLPDPDGTGPLLSPETRYGYNAGRLATITDPNNHIVLTNSYDLSSGRVSQQKDAYNHVTKFDPVVTDPQTGVQTITITDARNDVWKDVYKRNVLFQRIDGSNRVTEFGHDAGLNTSSVKAPDGTNTTNMEYDSAGNLKKATAPLSLGSVLKQFTYDAQNNVRTVLDGRGKQTVYDYFPAGNLKTITLDGQQIASFTYYANGGGG